MRAALFMLALCACAGSGTRTTAAGEEWQQYVAALGAERWERVRTWLAVADYDYQGINQSAQGIATSYWRHPGDYYQAMRAPFGAMERGITGGRGWGRHPQTGPRQMDEQELLEARRDAVFYQPYLFATDYTSLMYVGRDTANGKAVDVIEGVVDWNGRTERLMFDVVTHLPVRLLLWEGGPEAERQPGEYLQARFDLSDYRNVDGIMLPHRIVRQRPNSRIIYAIRSLHLNAPVADSMFRQR